MACRRGLLLAALAIVLLPAGAWAGEPSIAVTAAWARPTLGQSRIVAAYATILNAGEAADRVLGVEAEIARAAEIHATEMVGDVMQMRRIEALEVAAGRRTELKPGGTHVMLIDVVRPLKQGERITLTFRFERHPPVSAEAIVSLKPPPGPRGSFGAGG